MQNDLPLVSVIITTFKRSDMLKRAVLSVINQDYANIEIIVVDDNDPDSQYRILTERVMSGLSESYKLTYLKHSKNMNGSAARNTGIHGASGEFVCFLDDDDTYRPEKVRLQVDFLLAHTEYNAVYCGWEKDSKTVKPTKSGDLTFELLSGTDLIYTNVIMMKRDIAIGFGGWDVTFRRNQEAAFLLRYFRQGHKIGVVSEVLVDFDSSDRSNASKPKQNEKDFEYFLSVHEDLIDTCEKISTGRKNQIYSYRYRGVLLSYLKNKDLVGAGKIYFKMIKRAPIRFNADLIKYIFRKVQNKDVFL